MALYVHPENQQLLWGIINTNPHLTEIFGKYHPTQKAEWFKSIIETFYKQYEKTELTKNDVHKLNKDTLAYMIQLTHQIPPVNGSSANSSPIYEGNVPPAAAQPFVERGEYTQQQQPPSWQQPPQMQQQQHQWQPPPPPPPPQQSQSQQQPPLQYAPLNDRRPEPVDFRETVADEAISNMDELLKKHIQEREQTLNMMPPPQAVRSAESDAIPTKEPVQQPQPQLAQQPETISIPSNEILPSADLAILQNQILELKDAILYLIDEVKALKGKI